MTLLKSKRTDPSAIADSVLAVAKNNELLAECYSVFASSAEDRKRATYEEGLTSIQFPFTAKATPGAAWNTCHSLLEKDAIVA
jgi:hypothetical protein